MSQKLINQCWWAYLAVLIYRLGGVAGAVRRIVFAWPGEFTVAQIENSLRQLYPGLHPNEHQVADVIDRLRRFNHLEVVGHEGDVQVYRRAERRAPVMIPEPQLTFAL